MVSLIELVYRVGYDHLMPRTQSSRGVLSSLLYGFPLDVLSLYAAVIAMLVWMGKQLWSMAALIWGGDKKWQ